MLQPGSRNAYGTSPRGNVKFSVDVPIPAARSINSRKYVEADAWVTEAVAGVKHALTWVQK